MFFCIRTLFPVDVAAARAAQRGRAKREDRRTAPRAQRLARAVALLGLVCASGPIAAEPGPGSSSEPPPVAPPAAPPVAVASSLRFAWPGLVRGAEPAPEVRPTFGASLTLAAQMLSGAPFEVLVAADVESVQRLVEGGNVDAADVVRYADGRLAVAVRETSPIAADPTLDALADLMRADESVRIAIAHPDHAPYGRAALQALGHAGLASLPARRLARGENAAQALQFLLAGAVDAALVPTSLALGAPESVALAWRDVPAGSHAPIRHALAPVRGASDASLSLVAYLRSCAARAALLDAGFAAPADVPCHTRPAAGG